MLNMYSPNTPRKSNCRQPKINIPTIMVGIQIATSLLFRRSIIKVTAPRHRPMSENAKPKSRIILAGNLLVDTKPLIAWSTKSIKLFLDLPDILFSHVYETDEEETPVWATSPRI